MLTDANTDALFLSEVRHVLEPVDDVRELSSTDAFQPRVPRLFDAPVRRGETHKRPH